jgi:hypothetical protein
MTVLLLVPDNEYLPGSIRRGRTNQDQPVSLEPPPPWCGSSATRSQRRNRRDLNGTDSVPTSLALGSSLSVR